MMQKRIVLGCAVALAAAALTGSAAAGITVHGDFNNDGFADLAIGVPFEDIAGQSNAGAVHVLYGTAGGLVGSGSQFWHLNSSGVPGNAERKDKLGSALGAGDFNGDGFDDLAVGIPGKASHGAARVGAVLILFGGNSGLTGASSQLLVGGSTGDELAGNPASGSALAVGDFNNDGFDDLAVGVPGLGVEGYSEGGGVQVLYGAAGGFIIFTPTLFTQETPGVKSTARADERFGSALAAGDFNNDGEDDLAIGVPGEKVNGRVRAGAVNVLYGNGTRGLTAAGDQFWHEDNLGGLGGGARKDDQFGSALSTGDFNGDGFADLAIGAPLDDGMPAVADSGVVIVMYGSATKLGIAGAQEWTQSAGIANAPDQGDRFGYALAAGDFNNDGNDDLAIGAPFEKVSGAIAGVVQVLYGHGTGLRSNGSQLWHQNRPGVLNSAQAGDMFGAALGAFDFDGDGAADLAIGVPGEKVGGAAAAGAVTVLRGSASRLTSVNSQFWTQASTGVANNPQTGDGFGTAVAR